MTNYGYNEQAAKKMMRFVHSSSVSNNNSSNYNITTTTLVLACLSFLTRVPNVLNPYVGAGGEEQPVYRDEQVTDHV